MKKPRGRPRASDNIRVVPVYREKVDIEKLGKAVIAMAEELAKREKTVKEGEHEKSA